MMEQKTHSATGSRYGSARKHDARGAAMSDNGEQFAGFSDNHYQHLMHTLAMVSLWLIIGLGVAAGVFGFIWGQTH